MPQPLGVRDCLWGKHPAARCGPLSAGTPTRFPGWQLTPPAPGRPTQARQRHAHRGPVRGRVPSLRLAAACLARGSPAWRAGPPPGRRRPAAPSRAPPAAASAAGPWPAALLPLPRADWLAGAGGGAEWPGRFGWVRSCRGAWRTGGSGAAARFARQDPAARPPASERPGAPRGARAPPGAAALAAMCSQLWFLTDRRIREDYPQVQILRALRQRCSSRTMRFRAVLMDQIAVTIVSGSLGELGGPGGWGGARGPENQRVGQLIGASPAESPLGHPNLPLSPETSSGWEIP